MLAATIGGDVLRRFVGESAAVVLGGSKGRQLKYGTVVSYDLNYRALCEVLALWPGKAQEANKGDRR